MPKARPMKLEHYQIKTLMDPKLASLRCKCPIGFAGAGGRAHTLWCPAYTWYQERRKERTEGGQTPDEVPKLVQTRLDWVTTGRYRGVGPSLVYTARKEHRERNRVRNR